MGTLLRGIQILLGRAMVEVPYFPRTEETRRSGVFLGAEAAVRMLILLTTCRMERISPPSLMQVHHYQELGFTVHV